MGNEKISDNMNKVFIEETVVGEIAEKVEETENSVSENEAIPSKMSKKKVLLIIAACFAVFIFAVFVLPAPNV